MFGILPLALLNSRVLCVETVFWVKSAKAKELALFLDSVG